MSLSTEFLRFGAALFAIMNPFGAIPIFLSLTADNTPAERRRIGGVAAPRCWSRSSSPRSSAIGSSASSASRSAPSGPPVA